MSSRTRDLFAILLGLLPACLPLSAETRGKKESKGGEKHEEAEERTWEVGNPPDAEFVTATIDTAETTWGVAATTCGS